MDRDKVWPINFLLCQHLLLAFVLEGGSSTRVTKVAAIPCKWVWRFRQFTRDLESTRLLARFSVRSTPSKQKGISKFGRPAVDFYPSSSSSRAHHIACRMHVLGARGDHGPSRPAFNPIFKGPHAEMQDLTRCLSSSIYYPLAENFFPGLPSVANLPVAD
jgi:hypothetical protein